MQSPGLPFFMASSSARTTNRRVWTRRRFRLLHTQPHTVPPISAAELSKLMDEHARQPPRPLTLSKLLSFAQPITSDSVLESVEYVFAEIPRRLALRVRALERLPFIVGMNPFIARTLESYHKSFRFLIAHPPVKTLEDNAVFTAQLESFVQSHSNDIPTMAKGFQECTRYMTPEEISEFLDGAIRIRIGIRLIAEQHIAISRALLEGEQQDGHLGILHTSCSPKQTIRMCSAFVAELCEATLGTSPEVVIDGEADATFAYIPVHLQYIFTEILKNSFRATVERNQRLYKSSKRALPIPPVVITIAPPISPLVRSSPGFMSIRVRDEGGGVSAENMKRIFSYSFTTAGRGAGDSLHNSDTGLGGGPYAAQHVGGSAAVDEGSSHGGLFTEMTGRGLQMGMGTIAGLGYGLPMSRLYARYFGGSLEFLSLDGYGSDVFLKLRDLKDEGDVEI